MTPSLRVTFTVALLAWMPACAQVPTPESEKPVHVILLAGQSNMAGAGNYGELDDATTTRIERAAQRVRLSVSGQIPGPLSFRIAQYHEQKYGFSKAFGPELFLGLTLAESHPTTEYLLVKTAQGGTALYGAWNPEWTAEKAQAVEKEGFKRELKLYELHLRHIRENLQRLQQNGTSYKIVGLLWMQGENDAAKEISARTYEANLRTLINTYRKDLNEPQLPFVIGQINSTYGRFAEGPEMVRDAMAHVAASEAHTELVATSTDRSWADFPKHSDNVHYNTEGQRRLGQAFALALSSEINRDN